VHQPLRNAFVSIVATKAAVKRGASNLNSGDSVWNSDNELATFNVSTKNFGVQLDANHHADMAQLTEMTQTISALAANGHTAHIADQAYSAIADIIRGSLKSIKDKNLKIEQGDIELVLQDLSKSLVEALATEKNLSTAQSLISAIERTLQGTLTLPISDKRFYKVFAKKIFGDLNKSSIKRKYTGLGGILNPSGNVLQLYQIGNKSYLFEDLVKLARKTFVKQEQFGINAYFEANPGVDKCQVLAQLLILRESNPETELFAPLTGKDAASIERYKAETISRIAHALDPEVYGKMPGYGLKLVDLGDVQVLDSVAYYDANSDLTKAPVALELTNIKDYLNLKWNIKPTAVYFNATKPHDLRPQIEHWTCEERYVQDSSKKDTWSEPSLFMLYNIEYMLDAKKKRWEDPILASAAKNSKWAMMLKGLLYNQELYKMFHDPTFASVPDAQKNQIALNNAEKTINDLLSTDSSVRTLTKIQVKKLLENLRMRAAELRAHGFDFGRLVELENGTGYDFNRYFCGYTFDISKEIKADSPMLQEATSIMAKTVDYKVDPAEVIMPKLYKSNYNLGNINLSEIDANYFAKANSFYTCSLITSKGESLAPVDFLVRTHTGNFNVVFYNKFADISEVYGEDITSECRFQDGWRLDEDGNKMYRIPQKGNFAIFVNANGVETLVIRNNQDVEKTMRNLLKSLDSRESSTPLVSIQPFLQTLNTKISLTPKLIDLCVSMNHIKTHNQMLLEDRNLKGDRLVEALLNVYTSREQLYKKDLANTLYNSFVKTLDIICTRIPTQALQSFMAMHVAALTNDESNNVFVTRW